LASSAALGVAYTFPTFADPAVTPTWRGQNLAGAPAGTYTAFEVLVDWTAVSGNPWSNESRVYFGSTAGGGTGTNPTGAGTAHTTAARTSVNGQSNGNPLNNLRFAGLFDINYTGGNPLALNFRQTFSGSTSNWQNIRVKIGEASDIFTAPTVAEDLGSLHAGETKRTFTYQAGQVQWYKFTLTQDVNSADGEFITIDTLGSSLSGGTFGANDTEIALFGADSLVKGNNDDFDGDGAGPNPLLRESLLLAGSQAASGFPVATGTGINMGANLLAGEYYLALSPYNLNVGAGWTASVTPSGTPVGNIRFEINTNVPEPATLSLLALGGLTLLRRRR